MRKQLILFTIVIYLANVWAQAQAPAGENSAASFQTFLARWSEAQSRFLNGDPTLWKQNCSQSEAATIFGAFGGYEKGWKEVGPRFDWAASQHKESGAKKNVEYLNTTVSGDLAFTVAIERDEARVGDQDKPTPRALRVTQVFRNEAGAWKLLHRHADPLLEKKAPTAASAK